MFIVRPELNTEEIEKRKSDFELFRQYCTHFESTNIKFSAEFRDDGDPSASITEYQGRLWYKDFGDPLQDKAINIYQFIMRKYNLTFYDSLKKINRDFNLGLGYNPKRDNMTDVGVAPVNNATKKNNNEERVYYPLKIKRTKWRKDHVDFWTKYDMTKQELKEMVNLFDIHAISHFWLTSKKVHNKMYPVNGIGFSYDYFQYKDVFFRKIYLPAKKSIFFTNCNNMIVQGYDQLPKKGKLVFITSSLKDIIILRLAGFYAVAPSNENSFIPEKIFNELKERFDQVIIFYDNDFNKKDNPGIKYAKKYSQKYAISYIHTPDNTEKDPSDFSKTFGRKELINSIYKYLDYAK